MRIPVLLGQILKDRVQVTCPYCLGVHEHCVHGAIVPSKAFHRTAHCHLPMAGAGYLIRVEASQEVKGG